jgi:cyanate permease
MAMHSTVGFSLSALGAWAVGIALDAAGGPQSASAWMAAFAVLAAGILLGPFALFWSRRETPQP